jgi:glycosyltransferase involved in cell wall biosynthesis
VILFTSFAGPVVLAILNVMDNLYYIAETDFSKDGAAANRIVNNVKAIINKNDYEVTIIGYGEAAEFVYDGITVKNVRKGKGVIQKLFYFVMRGFFVTRLLRNGKFKPKIVIFYGYSPRFLLPLLHYVHRKNIKIVIDIVEWYNPSHLPMGKLGPLALDLNVGMKYFIPKCDGVIAISSFLQDYYASKKLKTVRVPVLIDTVKVDKSPVNIGPFDNKYLNLIYAGYPGKKDLVVNVIEAVERLNKEGLNIRFHLLGLTTDELEVEYQRHFSAAIICHGKIAQNIVAEYLKQADFSVLLRPNERYAEAGFPTKFVESLNAGLPVIANLTGDLSLYLKDGYNGFVVKDSSCDSLVQVINKITPIDRDQLRTMRKNANLTAKDNFDYRLFSDDLSIFLGKIINPIN